MSSNRIENISLSKPPFVGERVKLGELISRAASQRCGNDSYPVLSMTMHYGIVEQKDRFKKAVASKDTSKYKVVYPNQLVVGFPIDEGVINVQNHDFVGIMSPAYKIWDIDTARVDPAYLELALHSPQSMAYYSEKMRGTTARRRSMTDANLCALALPLPELVEQRRVIGVFKTLRAILNKGELYFELLDQLIKSRFVEMFGDYAERPEMLLGEASEFVTVGIANAATHAYSQEGVAMLRNLNVRENCLDDSDLVYIKEEFAEKYRKKRLHTNDILVTRTGYPGIACLVPAKYEGCQTFTTLIVRLKRTHPLTALYICHLINSPYGKEYVEKTKAGSSQQNFGATSLKQMPIGIPPLERQNEFSDFVAQVDKSRFIRVWTCWSSGTSQSIAVYFERYVRGRAKMSSVNPPGLSTMHTGGCFFAFDWSFR